MKGMVDVVWVALIAIVFYVLGLYNVLGPTFHFLRNMIS